MTSYEIQAVSCIKHSFALQTITMTLEIVMIVFSTEYSDLTIPDVQQKEVFYREIYEK